MLVNNNLETAKMPVLNQAMAKDDKKGVSPEKKPEKTQAAAEVQISNDAKQKKYGRLNLEAIALENVYAAQSNVFDVAEAEKMISQANANILDKADESVQVQSGQSAASVMELLR